LKDEIPTKMREADQWALPQRRLCGDNTLIHGHTNS
jgi:hypothetical protein